MFTEKNIPKLIFFVPSLVILITVTIICYLIIKKDYEKLAHDTNQIRKDYIKNEKELLKTKIKEVLKFIKYTPENNDTLLLQTSVLNFIQNIIQTKNSYIFVIDENSNIIYHPEIKVGTNTSTIKDSNGLSLAKALINKAKSTPDGEFVSYYWNNPNKNKKEKKTTFVYYLKNWKWVIAIGTYMDDIEEQIKNKIIYEEKIINDKIIKTIKIACAIVLSILIFSYFFSTLINKIFKNYRKNVEEQKQKLKELNHDLEKLANEEKRKRALKEKEFKKIFIDRLTGLPNRLKLSKDLEKNEQVKLMILNINRFTDINNFYSHKIADKLLIAIANFLENLFKANKSTIIYKLPIDEFAILTTSKEISSNEFVEICKAIIDNIEYNPFIIDGNEIIVSITGGISLDQEDSFINADTALKIAKEKNKDFIIYDENANIEINYQNNIKMTKILKEAINEDRIVVFKQPIINNKDNSLEKYECLVRIKQNDGNIIPPILFLDIAKKIKLYPKLTRTIIHKAFEHFKDKNCDFSINLTLDDILNESTVKFIKYKLDTSNIANHVIFEIVETEGIDNFEEVSLFIKQMKEYGCKIAIDDFGTGYSNFEYMMRLNVDFIKIDGSFIKNVDTDTQSQILTELIISFAKKQNIKTVAEFVHSSNIHGKVKSMNIDYSQGYYLGEPKECL
ncbi:EAL domain-containing protein [Arcobacter sp.]|uniref:EAL domain-containing protein n=1 Tax=Arcobacter sp. TaxID=1872629 RepID=UPI003D1192D0